MASQEMNDALLDRLIRRESQAWYEFSEAWRMFIYQIIYRVLQNDDDSEDCYQIFVMRLPKALESYKKELSFQTWLGVIARREAVAFWKRQPENRHIILNIDELQEERHFHKVQTPVEELLAKERALSVMRTIASLGNDKNIVAFYWRHIHDWTYERIAEYFETDLAHSRELGHQDKEAELAYARELVHRGKSKFKDKFNKEYPGYLEDN